MHSNAGASLGMYKTIEVIRELVKLLIILSIVSSRKLLCIPLNDMCQESRCIALSAERYSGNQVRDGGQGRTPSAYLTERCDGICVVHTLADFMDPGLRVPHQLKCMILCLLGCEGLPCDTMTVSIECNSA
jgi:hypothetical protein